MACLPRHHAILLTATTLCLLTLQACDRTSPNGVTRPQGSAPTFTQASNEAAQSLDLVARGLALALNSPDIRQRVLMDLRDSPFPKHRLHLFSYLNGQHGRAVAVGAAAALQMDVRAFLHRIAELPELEFWMPVHIDRITWTGTDDIVVVGTMLDRPGLVEAGIIPGYSTTGEQVNVPTRRRAPFPLLAVAPAQVDFGSNPEAIRTTASTHPRNTVSTAEEEFALQSTNDCDETAIIECNDPTSGPDDRGLVIPNGYTWKECTNPPSGSDADYDGLHDGCEYELAYHFRPRLRFHPLDEDVSRESYWTVRPTSWSPTFKIFYLLAYHRDTGSRYSHYGDSEFIVLTVTSSGYTADGWKWRLDEAYLSAHWGAITDSSESVPFDQIQYDGVYGGRPYIWVARDKHANYKSYKACEAGAAGYDSCDQGTAWLDDFDAFAGRDIGNNAAGNRLINGVTSTAGYPGSEAFWTGDSFCGWYSGISDPENDCAGPYKDSLRAFSF